MLSQDKGPTSGALVKAGDHYFMLLQNMCHWVALSAGDAAHLAMAVEKVTPLTEGDVVNVSFEEWDGKLRLIFPQPVNTLCLDLENLSHLGWRARQFSQKNLN